MSPAADKKDMRRACHGVASHESNEGEPGYYVVRLVAYGLIIAAIVDKNRTPR